MKRPHRPIALLVLALVAGLLAASGPSATAAPVVVTPDVAILPAGALPALPYVDWPNKRIVDGSRRISIAGIKARVTALHKVDGGYLLARRITEINNDLVFVSNAGARRVLIPEWERRSPFESLNPGLAVSHNGDKVITNAAGDIGGETLYADTRVLSLPGGKVLRKRSFGPEGDEGYAGILGFGVDRALITVNGSTQWWNPAKNTLSRISGDDFSGAADLTAWQWALTEENTGDQTVGSIPPRTSTSWPAVPNDEVFGPWSPDDTLVVGLDKLTFERGESTKYTVFRASDGAALLRINGNFPAQVSWETDSSLLLRTRIEGSDPDTYQLIRCTLAGVCTKVGPSTTELAGSIIPATRRNS